MATENTINNSTLNCNGKPCLGGTPPPIRLVHGDHLSKFNYLNEFKTDWEKAQARKNLGIDETLVRPLKFSDGTTTDITVGGLDEGTDVSGLTPLEVLNEILIVEFAPKWTNATVDLAPGSWTKSVGDNMLTESEFDVIGNPASAGEAIGGTATNSFSNSDLFGKEVTTRTSISTTLTRTYAQGTTLVVSSKGNLTNKTASNTTTKLDNAEINDNITSDYYIKEISTTDSSTIYFAYPIFIDEVLQTLDYSKTSYTKSRLLKDGESMIFSVPSTYKDIHIFYLDNVTKEYVDVTPSVTESVTRLIGSNKLSVKYTNYIYLTVAGYREYKLTFTIA